MMMCHLLVFGNIRCKNDQGDGLLECACFRLSGNHNYRNYVRVVRGRHCSVEERERVREKPDVQIDPKHLPKPTTRIAALATAGSEYRDGTEEDQSARGQRGVLSGTGALACVYFQKSSRRNLLPEFQKDEREGELIEDGRRSAHACNLRSQNSVDLIRTNTSPQPPTPALLLRRSSADDNYSSKISIKKRGRRQNRRNVVAARVPPYYGKL